MSPRGLLALGAAPPGGHVCRRHDEDVWSRRHFLMASGAAAGAVVTLPLWAEAAEAGIRPERVPKQVPGFSPLIFAEAGVEVPFFLPIEIDPFTGAFDPVADPLTIGDFNGWMGVVEADGRGVEGADGDGQERTWACDVRFMDGVYRDRNDKFKRSQFGFF